MNNVNLNGSWKKKWDEEGIFPATKDAKINVRYENIFLFE